MRTSLLAALLACSSACGRPTGNGASPPSPSPSPAPLSSPTPTPSPAPPPSGSPSPPASSAPASSASSVPSSWAHASNARVGITFSYPADTFRLTETPEGLLLASTLTRAELGGDPHPANWTYSMLFSPRAGDRRAAISRELPTFVDILFPDGGQLDVNSGMSSQATVAGKDAYRVSTGIEGYDDDDLFVDLGAKGTLLIRCRTVGDVMGAKPPEADQSATCAAVVRSIGWR